MCMLIIVLSFCKMFIQVSKLLIITIAPNSRACKGNMEEFEWRRGMLTRGDDAT